MEFANMKFNEGLNARGFNCLLPILCTGKAFSILASGHVLKVMSA
jgi:TusA-related sulfurtransferase